MQGHKSLVFIGICGETYLFKICKSWLGS